MFMIVDKGLKLFYFALLGNTNFLSLMVSVSWGTKIKTLLHVVLAKK